MIAASGWMVMFGLTFFFASWGPATTTYIIPSELFPTKWRVTGYSFCAAAGTVIVFLQLSNAFIVVAVEYITCLLRLL